MNIKPEIDGFNAGWKAGKESSQAEIIDINIRHADEIDRVVIEKDAEIDALKGCLLTYHNGELLLQSHHPHLAVVDNVTKDNAEKLLCKA